jgi:D-amino-acid dehydrogenase
MTKPKSVVIIGGGIIGLCTAYYAMRKGHQVTVVEQVGQLGGLAGAAPFTWSSLTPSRTASGQAPAQITAT